MLLGYFMRRVYDAEAARDLTAETFAQALLSERRFRGATKAEANAWLFTIGKRQFARYVRKGIAERRATKKLGIQLTPLDDEDATQIERLADVEGLRALIIEALKSLSAGQRAAVELRILEELPYPEVASRLGISEQAARARVSRALRILGQVLPDDLDIDAREASA
jgi:RNA polymerase sigma-70 factor (ECF subfamily)